MSKLKYFLLSFLVAIFIVNVIYPDTVIAEPIIESKNLVQVFDNKYSESLEKSVAEPRSTFEKEEEIKDIKIDIENIKIKDIPIEGEPPLGNRTDRPPKFVKSEKSGLRMGVVGANHFYLRIKKAGGAHDQIYQSLYDPKSSGSTACEDLCTVYKGENHYPWFSVGSSQNDRTFIVRGYNFTSGQGTKRDVAFQYYKTYYQRGVKYELQFEDIQENNRDYQDLVIEVALVFL